MIAKRVPLQDTQISTSSVTVVPTVTGEVDRASARAGGFTFEELESLLAPLLVRAEQEAHAEKRWPLKYGLSAALLFSLACWTAILAVVSHSF